MLHHWFKPTTVALAGDGIALLSPGNAPRLLCDAKGCYTTRHDLIKALSDIASSVDARRVRFVISNQYVRYGVLPWQKGIVSRDDWLALAQHDFRNRFGAVADNWEVRVTLNGYGKNVISCAIDQALIEDLKQLALSKHWHIVAIEPLLMVINKLTQKIKNSSWLLIAEPERVVLCESLNQEWQKFSVISPPEGKEQELSLHQIARSLLKINPSSIPEKVITCIAPKLGKNWHCNEVTLQPLPTNQLSNSTNSAIWMAGL